MGAKKKRSVGPLVSFFFDYLLSPNSGPTCINDRLLRLKMVRKQYYNRLAKEDDPLGCSPESIREKYTVGYVVFVLPLLRGDRFYV